MQEGFYAVAFRKQMYAALDQTKDDLDEWMDYYNNERPHSGRYCFSKTPMDTFIFYFYLQQINRSLRTAWQLLPLTQLS